MAYKFKRAKWLIGVASLCILTAATVLRTDAIVTTNTVPQPNLSFVTGAPNQYRSHYVNIRQRTGTDLGNSPSFSGAVYLPASTTQGQWQNKNSNINLNSTGLDVTNDGICQVNEGSKTDNYVLVTISSDLPYAYGTGSTNNYYIKKQNVCAEHFVYNTPGTSTDTNNNNTLYSRYKLPKFPGVGVTDPESGLYKITVRVAYITTKPDAGHASFKFSADNNGDTSAITGAKTSQGDPKGSGAFPLRGRVDSERDHDTTIDIPFGPACKQSGAVRNSVVGLYDADNGSTEFPLRVKFRVYKTYDYDERSGTATALARNSWIPQTLGYYNGSSASAQGTILSDGVTFVPVDGKAKQSRATFTMEAYDTYVLEVFNYDTGNAIDTTIPTESIFGDQETCKRWNIEGTSTVNDKTSDVVAPGARVIFKHELTNQGKDSTDPIEYRVRWTYQKRTSGITPIVIKQDRIISPGPGIPPNTSNGLLQPFTVDPYASDGDRYCQDVYWKAAKDHDPTSYGTSDSACITVKAPVKDKTVYLKSWICIDNDCSTSSKDIEVGSGAHTIRRFVTASDFPIREAGSLTYSEIKDKSGNCTYGNTTNNKPSDKNCYIQASFSVTCARFGLTQTASVIASKDSNGTFVRYCESIETLPPQTTIGASNCTVLKAYATNSSNGTNGWDNTGPTTAIEPGYKVAADGKTTRISTWNIIDDDTTRCIRVVGHPYFKVYGGDVRTGSAVTDDDSLCSVISDNVTVRRAGISSWNTDDGANFRGASVQNAAFARGTIDQFVSGKASRISRTFANTLNTPYGGESGSGGPCVTVPFPAEQISPSNPNGYNVKQSPLEFFPMTPARYDIINGKVTVYVEGNVFINRNIVYANSGGSWASVGDIPQFTLVIRNGSLYIDPLVTQLDGNYIVLTGSDDAKVRRGHIYTCAKQDGNNVVPDSESFRNCTNRLIVNGSFTAKQIHLQRDCGSTLNGIAPEATIYTTGSLNSQNCGGSNGAAEIINYTPESWIPSSTVTPSYKYDSIISLPPVL